MAGRPPNYVSIGFQDLAKLAFFYMSCVKQADRVGECNLEDPCASVLGQIQAQSSIRIRPEQLENLVYHYKQAVMNGLNPAETLDLSEKSYQQLMRNLQKWIPEHVKPNRFGELTFKGFKS